MRQTPKEYVLMAIENRLGASRDDHFRAKLQLKRDPTDLATAETVVHLSQQVALGEEAWRLAQEKL